MAAAHLVRAQDAFRELNFRRALALTDSAEKNASIQDHELLADASFLRARVLSELNQSEKARAAYERVLSLSPDYRGAWLNLGNDAFRRKEFSRALACYRQEKELYPEPGLSVLIGRSHAEVGRVDSARIAYEEALEKNARFPEAHIRLSQLYEQSGELDAALAHARRALELDADNAGYRYLVGLLLLQTERTEDALSHLQVVATKRPADHEAHHNLGQALARLGRMEEAADHMSRADSLRELDRALNEWETLTTSQPNDPAIWATYGFALAHAGRISPAIRAYSVALYLDPGNAEIRLLIANLYHESTDYHTAISHYRAALSEDPGMIEAWVNSGIAYARLGRMDSARQAWEAALRLDPDHEPAATYLKGLPKFVE